MPLQDRPDYQEWIARRIQREAEIRTEAGEGEEITECVACGTPIGDREFIDNACIECLAFDFGCDYTHRRIAEGIRGIAAALATPASARALVMHSLDRVKDLLSDVEHNRDAT